MFVDASGVSTGGGPPVLGDEFRRAGLVIVNVIAVAGVIVVGPAAELDVADDGVLERRVPSSATIRVRSVCR